MLQQDAFQAQLEALKREYAAHLPAKIARIQAGCEAFFAAPWTPEACAAAYRLLHSLAGSSGTYGFAEICQTARGAEAVLRVSMDTQTGLSQAQKADVRAFLAVLTHQAAQISPPAAH